MVGSGAGPITCVSAATAASQGPLTPIRALEDANLKTVRSCPPDGRLDSRVGSRDYQRRRSSLRSMSERSPALTASAIVRVIRTCDARRLVASPQVTHTGHRSCDSGNTSAVWPVSQGAAIALERVGAGPPVPKRRSPGRS